VRRFGGEASCGSGIRWQSSADISAHFERGWSMRGPAKPASGATALRERCGSRCREPENHHGIEVASSTLTRWASQTTLSRRELTYPETPGVGEQQNEQSATITVQASQAWCSDWRRLCVLSFVANSSATSVPYLLQKHRSGHLAFRQRHAVGRDDHGSSPTWSPGEASRAAPAGTPPARVVNRTSPDGCRPVGLQDARRPRGLRNLGIEFCLRLGHLERGRCSLLTSNTMWCVVDSPSNGVLKRWPLI
jgi:hypothetical protein